MHLFSRNLTSSGSGVTLKPLSTRRWTPHTAAIDTILKGYTLLLKTLEEVHSTTHDEYGLKAGGYLNSLGKFSTLFGLRLAHTLYCAAEQVSLLLQREDVAMQEALSVVDTAKMYLKRLRSEEEFNCFYDTSVQIADQLSIGQPELPKYITQHNFRMVPHLINMRCGTIL